MTHGDQKSGSAARAVVKERNSIMTPWKLTRVNTSGFTLIELLIVVAIIAILAAIAVPNFLEAQTRAKVSRCRADMRSMATGLETYNIDNNSYVWMNKLSRAIRIPGKAHTLTLERLTTPIAYLNAVTAFKSPFPARGFYRGANLERKVLYNGSDPVHVFVSQLYWYVARNGQVPGGAVIWGKDRSKPVWYIISSAGPQGMGYQTNNTFNNLDADATGYELAGRMIYDSTNGTVSEGGLHRTGGAHAGQGKAFYDMVQASQ